MNSALYGLIIGRHATVKAGILPAGWQEDWSDAPEPARGQITGCDHDTGTVEIGGWWYYATDIDME